MDHAVGRPAGVLAPLLDRCVGYRYEGFPPGNHLGLPSTSLTVVISLGAPTMLRELPDPHTGPASFQALVGGLHTRPVVIAHDGCQYGIQLGLAPTGARSLLGLPAGELGSAVVPLEELLPATTELVERMTAVPTWAERFAILEEVLSRYAGRRDLADAWLGEAWLRLVGSGGRARVGDLATELAWSRRHFGERFRREYGITPKDAARVTRFARSRRLLEQPHRPTLAKVAFDCGYADQSHLAREWNELAGCPPSAWLAGEELPFVQDESMEPVAV